MGRHWQSTEYTMFALWGTPYMPGPLHACVTSRMRAQVTPAAAEFLRKHTSGFICVGHGGRPPGRAGPAAHGAQR